MLLTWQAAVCAVSGAALIIIAYHLGLDVGRARQRKDDMDTYKYDHDDPRCYENRPDDLALETATHYAIHFDVLLEDVPDLLMRADLIGGAHDLTGEYVLTDAQDWGEPATADKVCAIHLYQRRDETLFVAHRRAGMLASELGATTAWFTPAGDWAEQFPLTTIHARQEA